METDALLIGRVTYESFAGAWPDREGEFADKFNTMPKYVGLLDPREPGVEQHDRSQGQRRRGGVEAQGGDRRDHPGAWKPSARPGAARARPRRRAAPDGLPRRARHRTAPVRRNERQDRLAANRVEAGRAGRRAGPDLRATAPSADRGRLVRISSRSTSLGADPSHPRHEAVPDKNRACGRLVAVDLRGFFPQHPHEAARFSASAATGAVEATGARPSEDRATRCFATRSASLLAPPMSIDANECRNSIPTK